MLSPEEVTLAYQLMLGREPENTDMVNNLCQNVHSVNQLRETFINSAEFRQRIGEILDIKQKVRHRHPFTNPNIPVQTNVTEDQLSEMFTRINQEWEHLGEVDPYWSVVTQPHYHIDQFEQHRDQFYLSGKYACDIFLSALRRNGVNHNHLNTCLEIGAGVGRVTNYLADAFSKVIATDISKNHLSIAQTTLEKSDIKNVETIHLKNVDSFNSLEPVDAIYSVITLQHNPPPLITWMLRVLLKKLRPGGVASLQIPTYRTGYLFEVDRYLSTPTPNTLEMHFLPQSDVFKVIRETGCVCLEVREDGMVGDEDQMLSNTFIIQRPL